MPFLAPLIPILTAAAAATSIGTSIYSMTKGGGGGDGNANLEAENKKLAQDQQNSKMQAIRAASPEAQSQVGGALTDNSFAQLVAQLSGNPGEGQLAKGTLFGGEMGLTDAFHSMNNPLEGNSGLAGGESMAHMGQGSQDFSLTMPN